MLELLKTVYRRRWPSYWPLALFVFLSGTAAIAYVFDVFCYFAWHMYMKPSPMSATDLWSSIAQEVFSALAFGFASFLTMMFTESFRQVRCEDNKRVAGEENER